MKPENGGPCQGIRNSIPAQKKIGVHNEVVCFDPPDANFISKDRFIIHALGPSYGPYAYCFKFKEWLEKNIGRFDAIIIHGLWLYNSNGAFSFWKKNKNRSKYIPKIFLMPHGMLDPYFQKAKNRRLKALRNIIFWHLVEKQVVNGVDGLFFTCEQELLLARTTFPSYNPKAELNVGYGIVKPPKFIEEFKTSFLNKCPDIQNKPYWLFLSRIHPKKGVDLLLKVYLELKKSNYQVPDLVIAGPGLETSFGQRLQNMGQSTTIHFPGMLLGEEKWGAFYGCDAFVLPSHQENFGIAVVEAMACKKPVLISNQVNIWREIKQGKGGLISEDTENGIRQMLEIWLNFSREQKLRRGLNAGKIFKSLFTTEKAAEKMIETIQQHRVKKNHFESITPVQ